MGQVVLPTSGYVYLDAQILIYSVETFLRKFCATLPSFVENISDSARRMQSMPPPRFPGGRTASSQMIEVLRQ